MMKQFMVISALFVSTTTSAAVEVDFYKAPLSSLKQFQVGKNSNSASRSAATSSPNTIQLLNQTQIDGATTTRYQQLYKGIPVVGGQVMISVPHNQGLSVSNDSEVNGQLIKDVQLNIQPSITSEQALELAKTSYIKQHGAVSFEDILSELQIRPTQNKQLSLVYLVSFRSIQENKPAWPFFVIDAHTGVITKQWNNIKNVIDTGPGGNEKTHEYWYGKDGLPGLNVIQKGTQCVMESAQVRLVSLKKAWDWNDKILTPFQYACKKNVEEPINGGFSPANDAYYFGHTIVAMYKNWYGVNALQNSKGAPMKLIMRVHFGTAYDNAFWDGKVMSFGDGADLYPLVSLEVAGHEVTHGFTEQHSNLEYHDQSGALNESLSDMGGQASRAYLLEETPILYAKAYLNADEVSWSFGETIMRDSMGKALRFMDLPSSDGSSADCLDKNLAQSNGVFCAISYADVMAFAKEKIASEAGRQDYIVHTASGVFNKAFYLMAQNLGIKKAYQVMIVANTKYLQPTSDFKSAACAVIKASKDLAVDVSMVKTVFGQVGIDTTACPV